MQIKGFLLSSFNKFLDANQKVLASIALINFLVKNLYVIGVFNKYTWMIPLKYKKGITITNSF